MTQTAPDITPVDLSDSRSFVPGVPHAWLAYLRRHDPVHWQEEPGGPGYWAVTKYHDCVTVNREFERFSSAAKGTMPFEMGEDEDRPAEPDDAQHGSAAPHPLPTTGQQGVHAPHGARPRAEHPPVGRCHHRPGERSRARPTSSPTSRPSCPCRSSRNCWACPSRIATECSTGPTGWSAARIPSTNCKATWR